MRYGYAVIVSLLVLIGLCDTCLATVPEHPEYTVMRRVTTDYFSTASMLMIYDDFSQPGRKEAFEQTWADICLLLEEIDASLSLAREDSDVRRFNALAAGESMVPGPHMISVLKSARRIYNASEGTYDPTVSRLVDLYGFSPRFTEHGHSAMSERYDRQRGTNGSFAPPHESYIQGFRELTALSEVEMRDGKLTKRHRGIELEGVHYTQTMDLGGIGKGYAVDCVMELLRKNGYAYGYFSCGGSSIGVLGRATASEGAPGPAQWGVAITSPRCEKQNDQSMMRVFLQNSMLSTSGDYEHAYFVEGIRYTHLIDPRTGYPINMPHDGIQRGVCSATVFGESAALCDALSTTLCILGIDDALELMNSPQMKGYHYVLILYSDDQPFCEVVTNLQPEEYQLLDAGHFRLACEMDNCSVVYNGSLL